jgi:hypothetical protein
MLAERPMLHSFCQTEFDAPPGHLEIENYAASDGKPVNGRFPFRVLTVGLQGEL